MRRVTEPKLVFGFVLIFGILCVNALVLATNMQTVTRNRESVEHSHEVTAALEAVVSTMKDAETGQRGYLLTGEVEYLKPYTIAREDIETRLTQLLDLTKNSAVLHPFITSIQRDIEAKLSELQETIQLQQQGRASEAITVVLSNRGKSEMDSVRKKINEMEYTEQRLLASHREESRLSEEKTRITFSSVTVLGLILLLIVYLVIVRSTADRRRSAEALQKREEWLSTTLRSIGDAVIATDAEGSILFMNRVAEQLTGWTQADAAGKHANEIFVIVNDTTRVSVGSPISQVIKENRIVGLANHTVLLAKDGAETSIDDSAAPIHDSNGALNGVVLVFRNISERKLAQKQRELYMADLEQVNGRLQRAVTETHHRVKNNLQLISSMISLQVQDGDGTLSADEVNRLITNIRALATVQDVLTKASRREGGAEEVSTKEILEKLLLVHQESVQRHVVTAHLEEVQLPGAQGTALALLANELLTNAIKHGKSKVHIEMRVDLTSNSLELSVSDDGPGFVPGFDPLEAANTGLELAVSLARWDLQGDLSFLNSGDGGVVRLRMVLPTS